MTAEDAIRRAERYLDTAALVREDGDLETCVSRAYYAIFYVAREWLQRVDVETGTHQGLINQFGLHVVKEGPLPRGTGGCFENSGSFESSPSTQRSRSSRRKTRRQPSGAPTNSSSGWAGCSGTDDNLCSQAQSASRPFRLIGRVRTIP